MEILHRPDAPNDADNSVGQNVAVSDEEYDHDVLAAIYRMESGIAAKKLQLLARMHREKERRGDLDTEWFADTVAADTHNSIGRVSNDLALALQLTDTLPVTLALLGDGELDLYRVRKIADAARALTAELCTELEGRLYPDVLNMSVGRLRRHVNRVVTDLDPDTAEQRRQKSRADRHVWCEPEPTTGMGWLTAYLPGDDLTAINQHLDTLATSNNDGVRTMDQRRADALRDLLLHVPTAATASDDTQTADRAQHTGAATNIDSGTAATIYVTVAADTLLGLDNRAGQLRGYGPITAEHAREIAYRLQSEWIGVLVDNNGHPVTMTRNSYRFRGRLAEFIRLRDTTCTHPGCDRPADRCDIDHVIPWPRGQTNPDNASTECRRHHRLKTHTDWIVARGHNQIMWRKPNGQTLTKQLEPIGPTIPAKNRIDALEDDPPPF